MNSTTALKTANKVAGNLASFEIHKGDGKLRAIRITGTDISGASAIADILRKAGFPENGFRCQAGIALYWL